MEHDARHPDPRGFVDWGALEARVLQFTKDRDAAALETYVMDPRLGRSFPRWAADAYAAIGDWENYWLRRRPLGRVRVMELAYIKKHLAEKALHAEDVLCTLSKDNGLTRYGQDHAQELVPILEGLLTDYQVQHDGRTLMEDFWSRFVGAECGPALWQRLREFFPSESEFGFWTGIQAAGDDRRARRGTLEYANYSHYLFPGSRLGLYLPISQCPKLEIPRLPTIVEVALLNYFRSLMREAENTHREEAGIPRIGEGWVSEARLYRALVQAFPDRKAVHHGRPIWLGPQHLDVYFPDENVGVEYQGRQHYEPVEYFGGAKAFERIQKLDRRKANLCVRNGCILLHVDEGYDLASVVGRLRSAFQGRPQREAQNSSAV